MSVRSGGPAGLRLRPILLRYSNSLGTTASFSSLSQLGFTTSQLGLAVQLPYTCSYIPYFNYITDLVLSALRLLREDIQEVVDSMKPVKPQDEGQRSHVENSVHKNIGTWEHTQRTNIPTYSTITIGRSYIFKYRVPTVRQFFFL